MKKSLTWFVLVLAVVLMLHSCGGNGNIITAEPSNTTETSSPDNNTETSETIHLLTKSNTPNVVISSSASDEIRTMAETLQNALNKYGSVKGTVKNDYLKSGSHDSSIVEVLLGNTNYKESSAALESLAYGDWKIQIVGNKIVIQSYVPEGINKAITTLIAHVRNHASEGTLDISSDMMMGGTVLEVATGLPKFAEKQPDTIMKEDPEAQCVFFAFSDITNSAYDSYLAKLILEEGYTLYSKQTLSGNIYSSFTSDRFHIHTQFTQYDSMLRVEIENAKYSDLPELTSSYQAPSNAKKMLLTQVGLYYTPDQEKGETWSSFINGLSNFIRLGDGSFIIIDGGSESGRDDVNLLYNMISKQAPDPNHIVVAAWLFTHGHGDHIGTFCRMVSQFPEIAAKFDVERFIFSFPDPKNGPAANGYDTAVLRYMRSFANAKLTMAHPGQVFYLREATVTILFTPDLYYPNEITWFNDTSIQFTVDVAGKRILYTGDSGDVSSDRMVQLYGTDLKCDMMQTPHHTFEGGTYSYYQNAAPDYIIANTGYPDKGRQQNSYWLKSVNIKMNDDGSMTITDLVPTDRVKEVWFAWENVILVEFEGGIKATTYTRSGYLAAAIP